MHKSLPLFVTALAWALPAEAGAPLASETADSLETGRCELEAAVARDRSRDAPTLRSRALVVGCGVMPQMQAALEVGSERSDGERTQAVGLSAKNTLRAPGGEQAGWGLAYGVTMSKAAGSGWRGDTWDVVGLYSRELSHGLVLHANLGHAHSRTDRQGRTLWSLGLERPGEVTLAADVFGDHRQRPGASAGVGLSLGRGFSVNATLAQQFTAPRVNSLSLGAKLEF